MNSINYKRKGTYEKGHVPWTFGKKHTEEHKNKIRLAHLGKKLSKEHREKIIKLVKNRTVETRLKMSISHRGKKMSDNAKRLLSKRFMGKRNNLWKGGITPVVMQIRKSLKYSEWRKNIFIRDCFTCQDCNKIGGYLEAHHNNKSFSELIEEIKHNLPLIPLYDAAMIYEPLWDTDNGKTLCTKCHNKTKKGRNPNVR